MAIYTSDLDDLGWYVVEVTATLDVLDNLGDLDPLNNSDLGNEDDPDNIFLNTDLYDGAGNKIYGKEYPPSDFVYQSSFNITIGIIEVNETSITDNNTAPYMMPPPDREIKLVAGEALVYEFGRVYDFEGNDVSVIFKAGNADKYVSFDYETLTMTV